MRSDEVESETSDEGSSMELDDVARRIVLHVYDDESKEFTSLTTYHGMIRIYNSDTWPSRIFWCLVVVTCLILFMIHSGLVLGFYASRPTFTKNLDAFSTAQFAPHITVCREQYLDLQKVKAFNISSSTLNIIYRIIGQKGVSDMDMSNIRIFEDNYRLANHETFDVEKFIETTSASCKQTLAGIYAGPRLLNPCKYASLIRTEVGICWKISNLSVNKAAASIRIEVYNDDKNYVKFYIHANSEAPILSGGVHVSQGMKAQTIAKPLMETFLAHDDWGTCTRDWETDANPEYEYTLRSCHQRCMARQYLRSCDCLPLFIHDHKTRVCTLEELHSCRPQGGPQEACNCRVECERSRFLLTRPTYVKHLPENRNLSTIEIKRASSKIHYQLQQKRFKAVDLLSFVAGSMGLFLGMSCVTLLEIFMFLFKTVWGAVNDQRHRGYLEKLLGESVTDLESCPPQNLSHSVHTLSMGLENDNFVEEERVESNEIIEENIGVLLDPVTRRPSVFRLPSRHITTASRGSESRARTRSAYSATETSLQTVPENSELPFLRRQSSVSSTGMELFQMPARHGSHHAQRRKSSYTGFGF